METRIPTNRQIPVLGALRRTARLAWVEILKLVSHKLFPASVALTVAVTAALGFAAIAFTETPGSRIRFSNYTLWVAISTYGLQVGAVLLVALGAMAMSTEATARTLNTVLARPIRRVEFVAGKILSLVFATAAVIAAAALAAFLVGGTVAEEHLPAVWSPGDTVARHGGFLSYGDVVDPSYPDTVIATQGEVMADILFGFLLLTVPVLAGVSLGFLLGTLLDSAGLAIGLSVGVFLSLEATKFIPLFEAYLGRFAYNYPINRIAALMLEAGKGSPPAWDEALGGIGISAIYVGVSFVVSLIVFCRRDITL